MGQVSARAALKHELQFLKPGLVEQDVETVWWGEFVDLARQLIAEAKIKAPSTTSPYSLAKRQQSSRTPHPNPTQKPPSVLYDQIG